MWVLLGTIESTRGHALRSPVRNRVLNGLERFRAKACPGLDPGWIPIRVKKTRQNKNPEPRSGSIGTEKALIVRQQGKPTSIDPLTRHQSCCRAKIRCVEPASSAFLDSLVYQI